MANFRAIAVLAALTGATVGCTESQFPEATGEGQIRGINGIVNAGDAIFLIEEADVAQLSYKSVSAPQEFDDLNYNFNFDLPIPGASDRRLATLPVDVIADTEYTFVLAGPIDNAQIVLWERPEVTFDGSETVFNIGAGHVNTTLGEVDVYFAATGTAPALGNELGSIAFGEQIADTEFPAGEYEVILTAPNDPGNVLFTSFPTTVAAASAYTLTIFDADPSITTPLSVRLIDTAGGAIELGDVNFPPTAQFVHAAFGTGNVDVAAAGDFVNLVATGLGFGEVSADVDIATGPISYTFAPTGNTMSLLDSDIGVTRGSRSMVVFLGAAGSLDTLTVSSERRGLSTVGLYRITNATVNGDAVDVYFTEPGGSIENRLANIVALPFSIASGVAALAPGNYDLTITKTGETVPLAPTTQVTLAAEDIVEVVILDTVDPNVSELLIFSNINP